MGKLNYSSGCHLAKQAKWKPHVTEPDYTLCSFKNSQYITSCDSLDIFKGSSNAKRQQ